MEQIFQRLFQPCLPLVRIEHHRQRHHLDPRQIDAAQFFHVGVFQDRLRQAQLAAAFRSGIHQISFGTKSQSRGRNQFFANRIDGWIGYLRKELFEIVIKQLRLVRQNRQRRVGAHGADGLNAVLRHRADVDAQVLKIITEGLQAFQRRVVIVNGLFVGHIGQIMEVNLVILEPYARRVSPPPSPA